MKDGKNSKFKMLNERRKKFKIQNLGRKYVGETCRNVKVRFDEHVKTSGTNLTEVGKHLLDSPSCKISFEDCKVLGYESYTYRRKLKESLFIQQLDDGKLLKDKLGAGQL